jgi:hypothetical protein
MPVEVGGTIAALSVEVTTAAGAGGKVRLGIRTAGADGFPGNSSLLYDAGQIDSTSTGSKELTLSTPQAVATGTMYWVSVTGQVSSCSLRAIGSSNPYVYDTASPTGTQSSASLLQTGVSGALGANFAASASDNGPKVGVKWQ